MPCTSAVPQEWGSLMTHWLGHKAPVHHQRGILMPTRGALLAKAEGGTGSSCSSPQGCQAHPALHLPCAAPRQRLCENPVQQDWAK